MRVGVFFGGHAPEAGGGYSFEKEVLLALVESLGEASHQFTLIWPHRPSDEVAQTAARRGMQVACLPQPAFISRAVETLLRDSALFRSKWRWPSRLDRVVRNFQLDLIWFLGPGTHFVDAPYFTTVWDLQHRLTPWFPEMSRAGVWDARELATGWFLQRATKIITGTEAGKREIEFLYRVPASRVAVLPHPTPSFVRETAPSDGEILAKYHIPERYLFYPAQFWAHKNHASLVRALEILRDDHGLVLPLVLVGSDRGAAVEVQRSVSERRLEKQVHFLGFVPERDVAALYDHALALVYVSLCGPENLPPLEAFARACPVIATAIEGAIEQLGDAALLVDGSDPAAIAAAIRRIYDDDGLRRRLIGRGRERANRWTGRDFVSGVFKLLDDFAAAYRPWETQAPPAERRA